MMPNRMQTTCLRSFAGLIALAATLLLTACGGGSGAPNNPYAPLTLSPNNLVVVSGVTSSLTVTGGTAPYTVASSNPGVLPVTSQAISGNAIALTATGVTASTSVTITVTDAQSKTASATVTVQAGSLAITPDTLVAYSGFPATLLVSGGTAPYTATSSNPGILPVQQAVAGNAVVLMPANVAADTAVTITVQDAVSQLKTATVTVSAAPLLNSLTITPNFDDCGKNAICSGQTGSAQVTVKGPAGGGIAGRQVRYDVVAGPFAIITPAGLAVTTLTTTSDAAGNAAVILKANVAAPTQYAQLRATDLTSGQQLTGTFLIQQVTDGSKVLSVVPATATITGAYKGMCSSGFEVDYFIYGGTPPYRVTSTFPTGVTIIGSTVMSNGGYFGAITNGTCVNPLTFSILDATGRQTTASLINQEGTADVPVITPPNLVVVPGDITAACTNAIFSYAVSGGTPPYAVSASPRSGASPILSNSGVVSTNGGILTVGNVTQSITLSFVDSSSPRKTLSTKLTCTDTPVALTVTPPLYDYSTPAGNTCVGKSSSFVISGGVPPYSVRFATPPASGTISPTVVTASGSGFVVAGLVNVSGGGFYNNYVTVTDSNSSTARVQVNCP